MSKRLTIQDGNLEFDIATGIITYPSETNALSIVGENNTVASFNDAISTTDATTLQFAVGAVNDTITRVGGSTFWVEGFFPGQEITITGSASNDGTYFIANGGIDATGTIMTVEGNVLAAEGPTGAATLIGRNNYITVVGESAIRFDDIAGSWAGSNAIGVDENGYLNIRGYPTVHDGGTLIVFDGKWPPNVSVPPVDTDTAYSTISGYSRDEYNLWEIGTFNVSDLGLSMNNFVPDSNVSIWVTDVTDSFYRRTFNSDYATGAHLYWPTTNAIALSTDVAGVYSPLGSVYLEEKGTPGGDTAARGQLWVRDDNPQTLMFTDGDSTDFAVAGSGVASVLSTGTPSDNEIAVWTSTTNTLEGDPYFTWNGSTFAVGSGNGNPYVTIQAADTVSTIGGQDETDYDNSPTTEGTFVGGTGFADPDDLGEVLGLSDGTNVSIVAVAAGAVTEFTIAIESQTPLLSGTTLTQVSHSWGGSSGVGFSLTPDTDNVTTNEDARIVVGALAGGATAATPTIAFGDGDTGFYETLDDILSLSLAGTQTWNFASGSFEGNATDAAALLNSGATATVPTVVPVKTDTNTGIGSAAADQLSLIAGAKEMLRLVETGTATTDQVIITPGVVGGVANATPTLAFGDGDSGFYESADDNISIALAGIEKFEFNAIGFSATIAGGWLLNDLDSTTTRPGFMPNRSDADTGIGWGGANNLSIIAGVVEANRITAAAVQTTNATVTEIISVAVPSGEGFGFEIHIMGTEDATGDTVFERVFGAIRNQATVTALVGSTITDRTDDAGATTWVVSVEADDAGDALTVDVTGEAAHTIDWKVRVELLNV